MRATDGSVRVPLLSDDDVPAATTGGRTGQKVLTALLLLVPAAAALAHAGAPAWAVFVVAVAGLMPLSAFLGRATEEISLRAGPALGALLNASLGNAIELLIAAQILLGRDPEAASIVRASVVGSLVTNLLLLIGASMFAGGLVYKEQRFNRNAASVQASLLILAFAGLSVPTIFSREIGVGRMAVLSDAVCILLALVYGAGLVFTFLTHKHYFDTADEVRAAHEPQWTLRKAIAVLCGAVLAVGYLAHLLERTLDQAGRDLGLSKTFVGVVVIGAITNVAENLAAITYARKNDIDLPIHIGTSSAIQVQLFVVPLLVLIGAIAGKPFILEFSRLEIACMALPVLIINHLAVDGQCNWLEGALLMALYALIGTGFYFVP